MTLCLSAAVEQGSKRKAGRLHSVCCIAQPHVRTCRREGCLRSDWDLPSLRGRRGAGQLRHGLQGRQLGSPGRLDVLGILQRMQARSQSYAQKGARKVCTLLHMLYHAPELS